MLSLLELVAVPLEPREPEELIVLEREDPPIGVPETDREDVGFVRA